MIEKQDFNHIEDQLDQLASNKQLKTPEAVSYTHLTLPTT